MPSAWSWLPGCRDEQLCHNFISTGYTRWSRAIGTAVLSMPPTCITSTMPASTLARAVTMVGWKQAGLFPGNCPFAGSLQCFLPLFPFHFRNVGCRTACIALEWFVTRDQTGFDDFRSSFFVLDFSIFAKKKD